MNNLMSLAPVEVKNLTIQKPFSFATDLRVQTKDIEEEEYPVSEFKAREMPDFNRRKA